MIISNGDLTFLNIILDGFTPAEIKNCIEFIKRFTIINECKTVDLYNAIKAYFVINANYNNDITKIYSFRFRA
jgi:hypothetical protein